MRQPRYYMLRTARPHSEKPHPQRSPRARAVAELIQLAFAAAGAGAP